MNPITFFARGLPKGQPRPRAFSRGGSARVYDPGTAEGWKSEVAKAAESFLPAEPITATLHLYLEFFMPRPKAHYRGVRGTVQGCISRVIRDEAPGYHTGKPDADNLAKAVMDALTTLRMWVDDAQIAELRVRKLYDDGRGPGCIIRIAELLQK